MSIGDISLQELSASLSMGLWLNVTNNEFARNATFEKDNAMHRNI